MEKKISSKSVISTTLMVLDNNKKNQMKSLFFLTFFMIGTNLAGQSPIPPPPHPLRYDTILFDKFSKRLAIQKNEELALIHSLLNSVEDTTIRPVTRGKLISLMTDINHPTIDMYLIKNITFSIPEIDGSNLDDFPCYIVLLNKKSYSVLSQLAEYLKECRGRHELRLFAGLIKTYIRTLKINPNWVEIQQKFVKSDSCSFSNYETMKHWLTSD